MFGPVLGPVTMFFAIRCYGFMVILNPYVLKAARTYKKLSWGNKVFVKLFIFIGICWISTPENSEVYKYFAALFHYIITSVI